MKMRAKVGKLGEDIALKYLLDEGLTLRERNWRCGHLEVDLIMEDREYVHIIEVKSRTAPYLVSPEDAVVKEKQRRLFRAASAYVKRYHFTKEVIFDIVSVTFIGEGHDEYDIEYYKGAFIPIYV